VAVTAPAIDAVAQRLRLGAPPVFARVHGGELLLDARTLDADEIELAASALAVALARGAAR
jgi:hypothetical protein